MTKLALAINIERCVGCQTCAMSCKMSNGVPMGLMWNRVLTDGADMMDGVIGEYPYMQRSFLPMQCQHCENPPCMKVCPVGATWKDDKGRVLIHYDRCIGCRICMAACPYDARQFNWSVPDKDPDFKYGYGKVHERKKGIMEKCTLCEERTEDGLEPTCVVCCPLEARMYGDLDDPESEISKVYRERRVKHLLEDRGTKPQVFYFF